MQGEGLHERVRFDFSGARVLVTGGSQGIGRGIAGAFRDAGAEVIVTGRRAKAEDYDTDLSGFDYRQLEVTDREAIRAMADDLPRLDVLVNNAGGSLPGGRSEWEGEVFDEVIDMDLSSVFHVSQACLPQLKESEWPGGPSVIGIASMTSYFGHWMIPGYGAAKAGVVQLMKTLAVTWGEHGIRANAVAAGLTRSNMTAAVVDDREMTGPTLARTPLGRLGEPVDVAGPVLFLASPAASWITGQSLPVDGGYTVSM